MQEQKRVEAQETAYAGNRNVQEHKKTEKTHWSKPLLAVYLLLLVVAVVTAVRSVQAYESTKLLTEDMKAQMGHVLTQKQQIETELQQVTNELERTKAQFEESFNILYPAYVAVNNVRFVAKNEEVYHRYECTTFQSEDGLYTAHNTEYCELLGYVPCPACCP